MKAFLSILVSGLLLATAASAAPGDMIYAKPGRIVQAADGARLNLVCMGRGAPAVIFDSGALDWAAAWAVVQPRIARWTRVCSYDRAGTGFSAPGPMPRTSMRIAAELRSALRNGGIAGPYILVGNAFGGDNVRAFADLYPRDVAGLVLVDADASDVEPAAMRAEDDQVVSYAPRLRACGQAIAAGRTPPLMPHRAGKPDKSCIDTFFRGIPDPAWSPALNARLLGIARRRADMYDAFASEMEQMPADETFLQQHKSRLGAVPVRVITSRNHGIGRLDPHAAETPEHRRYEEQVTQAQARWLDLSSDAKQIFAPNSSEYVQFDAPDTVVAAIREVHDASRKGARRSAR